MLIYAALSGQKPWKNDVFSIADIYLFSIIIALPILILK
jgi:hypothetical protein